jgi:hypothetical protein
MHVAVRKPKTVEVVTEPKLVVVEFTPAQALLIAGLLANTLPTTLEAAGFPASPCFELAKAATGHDDSWIGVVAFVNNGIESSNPTAIKEGDHFGLIKTLAKQHTDALDHRERVRFLLGE